MAQQQNFLARRPSLALVQVMHAPAFWPHSLSFLAGTYPYLSPALLRPLPNLETEALSIFAFSCKFFLHRSLAIGLMPAPVT